MLDSTLHEHHLLRYEVELHDEPFQSYQRSAYISFYDENGKKAQVFKYGVITPEEIYDLIDSAAAVRLNNAYVKNFSLTEYRTNKGLDDEVMIHLHDFSAKKSFFDCDMQTDFSFAEFGGNKTIFEASIFGNGNLSFLGANFGDGDVNFKKAKFGNGSVNFKSTKFGLGNVSFSGSNFGIGNVSFVDANFGNGLVDFKGTYFGDGNIDFKFARFAEGDISFEKSIFGKGKKDFKNVEFGGGKVEFRRINFNDGDVSFEGVEFGNGKVSFRSSKFGAGDKSFELADFAQGEAQFDLVDFGSGTISFNQTKVNEISFTGCHLNCYADFRFGECDFVDLSHTIIRDIVDVKPENDKVVIKEMNLVGMRILGRLFIDWRANHVANLIYAQEKTSLFQKAEQFRILKENFRNNGQYDDEDTSYVEFKRCEAKANLDKFEENKLKIFLMRYPVYYFQKYIFDFIGRYATNPIRVLANMFLTFTVFSFIYFVCSVWFNDMGHVVAGGAECLAFNSPDSTLWQSFGSSLYYSGITFLTIGYGDYFAWGILKPVAVLEGFTGVFLMSYFTVAFVRKILR